ncbi:tumor necrosis factor receptor superfamily member 25 isoform X4 [Ictidomys tridecemlineatus]|uniref:TNF receptor superfamily member 25 n=1 Tax=Ictidomys tridecemlineatus TaxID=43179 RepID=I3MU90_ICTTR|nr:tumor necrosis factor receptor superfamily member 25 isoform X1 [Ictidomys tridecemlineatus]KAG3282018.1 TNF receptor superfamily member 25, transcript variant X1 [Ictidomys tridecemlineatus]
MLGPLTWRSLGKEGPPHGAATRGSVACILQAVLLLLLGVQGSFPGPRCDCTRDFQKRNGPFCCRGCPVGHYMKAPCTEPCGNSTCLPCPQGTFLARDNHFKDQCTRCQACDEEAFQVALENCSAVADTRCGCEPGWLIDCSVKPCRENSPFLCRRCPDCEALYTELPCSSRDADCGPCLPGFYEYGNGCVSCPTSSILGSCPEPCAAVCGWRQMFWAQVLVAGLVVLFLLGGTLIYTYHRCQPHKPVVPAEKVGTEAPTPLQATQLSASESAHTLLVPPGSSGKVCTVQLVDNSWTPDCPQIQEVPCQQVPQSWDQLPSRDLGPPLAPPLSPAPSAGSPAAVLQPGPQLYDVMDAVPARRWKEFVRTLGLREAEIEAVEVEIGRFRDQQYEMLKRWRQQQPAGLGAVFAALERMGLDGCAEDLRSRLQRGA